MNPIDELVDLVEEQSDVSAAVDALAGCLAGCDRDVAQLEKTFDALRRAFRKHVEMRGGTPPKAFCSFCHKSEEEVAAIVVASGASICDECTKLSSDVIDGRAKKTSGRSTVGAVLDLVARVRRGRT